MERTKTKGPVKQKTSQTLRDAMSARQAGEVDRALTLAKASLSEAATGEGHAIIGWALAMRGDLDNAIKECERGLACDPECALALSDFAHYLIERGEFDSATSYLERAFESGASDSRIHYDWGRVSAQRGLLKRAAKAYRDALSVDPSFQPAADGLIAVTQSLN
jgi:tetratricopeptide (TPR) repeat protein